MKRTPIKKQSTPIKRKSPIKKQRVGDKVETVAEMIQLAQMIFNRHIRKRDLFERCISSGAEVEQAGHYYPAGLYSGVRFDEINVNGQSAYDNCGLAGNLEAYRVGLIAKYGEEAVIELDKRAKATQFKKWTRAELQEIIDRCK